MTLSLPWQLLDLQEWGPEGLSQHVSSTTHGSCPCPGQLWYPFEWLTSGRYQLEVPPEPQRLMLLNKILNRQVLFSEDAQVRGARGVHMVGAEAVETAVV